MLDRETIETIFPTSDAPRIESAVSAPLRGHDSGGVVVVASTRPDFFDVQTLALVHVVADQFSRVFESEHLVEVERAAGVRAEFLGSLNDLLTTSLDVRRSCSS